MKKILIFLFIIFIFSNFFTEDYEFSVSKGGCEAHAATYYVATTGDNGNTGADGDEWATIAYGCSQLSPSDTLIIKDGTYTSDKVNSPPSGTAENYTIVKAQNDWGVIINGASSGSHIYIDNNYIKVQGIKMHGDGADCLVDGGDYVKIIRCASDGKGGKTNAGSAFNTTGTYTLFEECYAYGGGRYPMRVQLPAQYVVFRRCVVRFDYYSDNGPATQEPYAAFANYDCSNIYFQNCIAIDGKDIRANDFTYDGFKSFFTPNGANETHFEGCISLNNEGGYYIEDSPITNVTLNNCVGWGTVNSRYPVGYTDGYPKRTYYNRPRSTSGGPLAITNCTFGAGDLGVSIDYLDPNDSTAYNNLFFGFTGVTAFGPSSDTTYDYNAYSGNGTDNSRGYATNDVHGTDLTTIGLEYIVRIESGSTLKTAGQSGGQIGAEIVYQHGTAETLYGDSGWDTLTAVSLWPFPNEDEMKTDMAAVSHAAGELWLDADAYIDSDSPAIDGARGFCANTVNSRTDTGYITLTSYIWETLGNTGQTESLYGLDIDVTAPAAISNLATSTGDAVGEIDLTWTSPGDDDLTGTATSYDLRYSTSTINDGNWAVATEATGEPNPNIAGTEETMTVSGLDLGETYYFAIKTSDEVPNESSISNVSSSEAAVIPPMLGGCSLTGGTIN